MKLAALLLLVPCLALGKGMTVGSKKFTESVILAEVVRLALKFDGKDVQHKPEFGGTRILWNALVVGDIDLYPEYSGTLEEEILRRKLGSEAELKAALAREGIGLGPRLGFNNTYALGMRRARAQELGISKISDLRRFPALRLGLSSEFRQRQDGWPGLRRAYGLAPRSVRGLDHDVAYRALEQGDIEIIDLYTTDAEIPYYDLVILDDDRLFFPRYDAIVLYRLGVEREVQESLAKLAGKISEATMVALNRRAKLDRVPANQVAADFLRQSLHEDVVIQPRSRADRVLRTTLEHLELVVVSMSFAIAVAIPLGLIAAKRRNLGRIILGVISTIQTIPALALLVLMIKPLGMIGLSGIGDTPATIALFLYGLLPIVRNTLTGLEQIPTSLRETAEVLNLSRRTRLLWIELPLALPSILAGIKTALVLNVGFATLGALVGAGGYGQPILTGIRLDDYGLILEGAVPAAILALLCQWSFDLIEKRFVPPV